jgi:hypothetical protein
MSDKLAAPASAEAPITLDDLRHKALHIRDEVKDEIDVQVNDRRNRIIVVGVVAVFAVVGIAYLAGTIAGRRAAQPPATY